MGSIPIGERVEGKGKWVGNMSGKDSVRERDRDRDRRDSVLDGGERTV